MVTPMATLARCVRGHRGCQAGASPRSHALHVGPRGRLAALHLKQPQEGHRKRRGSGLRIGRGPSVPGAVCDGLTHLKIVRNEVKGD